MIIFYSIVILSRRLYRIIYCVIYLYEKIRLTNKYTDGIDCISVCLYRNVLIRVYIGYDPHTWRRFRNGPLVQRTDDGHRPRKLFWKIIGPKYFGGGRIKIFWPGQYRRIFQRLAERFQFFTNFRRDYRSPPGTLRPSNDVKTSGYYYRFMLLFLLYGIGLP